MNPSPDDFTLLNELWQMIEHDPTTVYPRKLLMEQLMFYGWIDAAVEAAENLLKIAPNDREAREFVQNNKKPDVVKPKPALKARARLTKVPTPNSDEERQMLEEQFAEELIALRQEAQELAHNMQGLAEFTQKQGLPPPDKDQIESVIALQNGDVKGLVSASAHSARGTARKMEQESDYFKLLDIAIEDLDITLERLRQSTGSANNDAFRELLAKRVRILVSSVPDELQAYPALALMHLEHEKLQKAYVNNESMLGDEIKDIPRNEFWVSEDGYAWSMDELASAIKANGGIMRNPLSKEMFSPTDIKMIILHPLGKALGALQLEQSQMSQGVRLATIEQLEMVAETLLVDDADDQFESRKAIDILLAYVATLPQAEQDAIDKLRVPAKDSHTGQEFDSTIGDAVRDGRANKICMHKTGDLLKQAARYLRRVNPNLQ